MFSRKVSRIFVQHIKLKSPFLYILSIAVFRKDFGNFINKYLSELQLSGSLSMLLWTVRSWTQCLSCMSTGRSKLPSTWSAGELQIKTAREQLSSPSRLEAWHHLSLGAVEQRGWMWNGWIIIKVVAFDQINPHTYWWSETPQVQWSKGEADQQLKNKLLHNLFCLWHSF